MVHGRGVAAKAGKATVQTGQWGNASEQGPFGDVSGLSGYRASSSTKVASFIGLLLCFALETALITGMATTAPASLCPAASVTPQWARCPCERCRGDRVSLEGRVLPRGGAASLQVFVGSSSGEDSLWRSLQGRMPLQAWGAWSLVELLHFCGGPRQAGSWYPGSHYADSSPRGHDERAGDTDGGETP